MKRNDSAANSQKKPSARAEQEAFVTEREGFMRLALDEARAAYAENEVPIGAVLVRGGKVLTSNHNRCEQLHDPTAHAELLCMQQAVTQCGGRLSDCTLYVTMEPCAMCIGAAINAKLPRLVFGAFDTRAGCCGSVMDLSDHCFLWSVEVWGGILEEECAGLLTDFFAKIRR